MDRDPALNPTGGRAGFVGIKVSDRQRQLLEAAAEKRQVTMSHIVREAIDGLFRELEAVGPPGTDA